METTVVLDNSPKPVSVLLLAMEIAVVLNHFPKTYLYHYLLSRRQKQFLYNFLCCHGYQTQECHENRSCPELKKTTNIFVNNFFICAKIRFYTIFVVPDRPIKSVTHGYIAPNLKGTKSVEVAH